jgi:hypothetical protein
MILAADPLRPLGEMSLTPGTSAPVSTATTPSQARTASRSSEVILACARS